MSGLGIVTGVVFAVFFTAFLIVGGICIDRDGRLW
jgi:hypothetical protein